MRHSGWGVPGVLGLLLAIAACTGDDGGGPPAGPANNDAAFTLSGVPVYVLAGDALTPATDTVPVRVTAPAGTEGVEAWIDGTGPTVFTKDGSDFTGALPVAALAPGSHSLVFAEPGAKVGFAKYDFHKSYALYVVTSVDWDDGDSSAAEIARQEMLHANHPHLKITHLIGPYTFTDPNITPARRTELADWWKNLRDTEGDELGTHIHPYCHFLETVPVTCQTMPSFVYPAGDMTGYSVRLDTYTRAEWGMIFAKVDEIWAEQGFGKPTSFRAGGWSADVKVLGGLSDAGYLVDSSANNWMRLEEWMDNPGTTLYEWNMMQWGPINETSQPYYPTEDSHLPGGTGARLGVLEIPDNGILADYVTAAEMIDILHYNWNGPPLTDGPRQLSIGYHNSITDEFFNRLDGALTYFDGYLAVDFAGPIVYVNMSELATVWPAP